MELRHENEMLKLELFNTNNRITKIEINNEKTLNKIKKLATQNCYGNERAILGKINELADSKSNQFKITYINKSLFILAQNKKNVKND